METLLRCPRTHRGFATLCSIGVLSACVSLSLGAAEARTWTVAKTGTADSQTIQGAIHLAQSGDSVEVDAGTYAEAIDYIGKDLFITSVSGPASTVIDCSGILGSCVRFHSRETHAAVLSGFTVTGGTGEDLGGSARGGGIFISNAQPSVTNNIIIGNSAISRLGDISQGGGGGIECRAADAGVWRPIIQANVIADNVSGRLGGGVSILSRMSPVVKDNVFRNNRTLWGDGGGVSIYAIANGSEIRNNVFDHNQAADRGGGIYAGSADLGPITITIEGNLVWGNTADGRGPAQESGGAMMLEAGDVTVRLNTVVFNTAANNEVGGIAVRSLQVASTIEHNVVASTSVGGIVCVSFTGPKATILHNLLWENIPDIAACGTVPSDQNVFADPLFCDPLNGNFTVAENSPALTSSFGPIGAYDVAGCGPVTPVVPATWSWIKTLGGRER